MALLVPEGMAYAELAGVPPQAAFYAAPIGLVLYALFGTSRQLVVAVSSGVAVMSASIIGDLAPADTPEFIALTAGLALLAGGVSVLAGLLRAGRIARFFSHSVLTGFVSGLAIFIIVKQLPKVFGLESGEGNSIQRLIELVGDLSETHTATLIVGLGTAVVMIIVERRLHRVPAALVGLVFGILATTVFGLVDRGVQVVGEIPAGLAPPIIPDITLANVTDLLVGAVAIALFVFAEAVGPAKSFASRHRYRLDEDQELIGLGMANVGAGLFQGFPIGASLSKSAASDAAGGRTQVSGLVAAAATAIVALFLTPLFRNLPEATLGAIVVVAVSGMVDVKRIRRLYLIRKADFALAMIALMGVLVFEEVLAGLLVAVIASLIAVVARISRPLLGELVRVPGSIDFKRSEEHSEGLVTEGLMILRPDQEVFFANAEQLRDAIETAVEAAERPIEAVILDLSLSSGLDVPGAEVVGQLGSHFSQRGVDFRLANVRASAMAILESSGVLEEIGPEKVSGDVMAGVVAYLQSGTHSLAPTDLDGVIGRIDALTDILAQGSVHLTSAQRESLARSIEELQSVTRSHR